MLNAFTRNYEDNSTEAGFQFTFCCDLCQDGYKTSFIGLDRKRSFISGISGGAKEIINLFGNKINNQRTSIHREGDALSERFTNMNLEWHKEHDKAFEQVQKEAKEHFNRCNNCRQWVCDSDFNEEEGLCVKCAPRINNYGAGVN